MSIAPAWARCRTISRASSRPTFLHARRYPACDGEAVSTTAEPAASARGSARCLAPDGRDGSSRYGLLLFRPRSTATTGCAVLVADVCARRQARPVLVHVVTEMAAAIPSRSPMREISRVRPNRCLHGPDHKAEVERPVLHQVSPKLINGCPKRDEKIVASPRHALGHGIDLFDTRFPDRSFDSASPSSNSGPLPQASTGV